ncbi:MAG: TlpA family protein disulfide reductase [Planctomycetia bacterium]|nr:TlpA family protein disulfide reductase [Planctomycetia bacterium]
MTHLPTIMFSLLATAVALTGRLGAAENVFQKQSRGGRFLAITGEFEKQYTAYFKSLESAKTDAERATAEKKKPSDLDFGKQILALVKEAPADGTSFDALVWIVENLDAPDALAVLDEALALFEKHHVKSPRLKTAFPVLAACPSERAESLLERLGEKGETREIRGLGLYHLARRRAKRLGGTDDAKRQGAIESLLERVRKEYGDIQPDDEEKTLKQLAAGAIFEIQNLRPGKMIPELAGDDVAGKPLKLSGFRGKVVLLVFWGTWCQPCMAKVPFERMLMEKFSGRPFTVVGVNCGDQKKKAAAVMKEQKMTWPSFSDGDDGPIVSRWNISDFPTVILIDAQGKILQRDPADDAELERAVAEAVAKAADK